MEHPKDIGDRSTLAIIFALSSTATASSSRSVRTPGIDLILEQGAVLRRVQCKTGRLRRGAVHFATCSTYAHHPNPKIRRRTYAGEIDDFAIFCPELGRSISSRSKTWTCSLAEHFGSTRRGTARSIGIRFAAPYDVARIDVY